MEKNVVQSFEELTIKLLGEGISVPYIKANYSDMPDEDLLDAVDYLLFPNYVEAKKKVESCPASDDIHWCRKQVTAARNEWLAAMREIKRRGILLV